MKKQSFTMRLFSVLLCVAMLCTFAPLTSLAKAAEQVYVGGVEVTADNAADVLGDGTVSYDKYTKTLTLKGAGIFDTYDTDEGSFGIFATGDLNVVLEGRAIIDLYGADLKDTVVGIQANGNLTMTGEGNVSCHIPPVKDFAAGLVAGGALAIDVAIDRETMMYGPVGFIEISVAKAAESYALVSENINLVLGNAPFELMAKTAVFSTAPTLTNFEFVACDGGLLTPDCDDFEPLCEEELLDNIENLRYFGAYVMELPNVEIGGVKLTMDNANDVFGDGTVYFDMEDEVLVFDNATITGFSHDEEEDVILGVASYGYDDLSIRLVGDNVIDLRDARETKPYGAIGIYKENGYDVNFFGDGSLTVYTGEADDFTSGLNLSNNLSLYDTADLTMYAGDANGNSFGMYLNGAIYTYGSGNIAAYGGDVTNGDSFGMFVYSDLYTYGSGDIAAYGGDVTDGGSFGMYTDDVKLKGVGDCLFVGGSAGEGGASYGASAWGIDLYGGKNEEDVLHGVRFIGETGAFKGDGSAVPYLNIHEGDYTTLCAQTMSEDDLAEPDDSTNSIETAKHVFLRSDFAKEYGVCVGDTWVTANNAADVLGDGTVSYDVNNRVLTLNNATINKAYYGPEECAAITNDSENSIYVCLIGDNVIDLTEADLSGMVCVYGMWSDWHWSFYGEGSLTVKVPAQEDTYSYGVYSAGDDIWVYDTAAITVELPNAENTYGFYCDECGIDSPNVSLLAGDTALYAEDCVWSNMDYTAKYFVGTEYNGEVSENDNFCYDFSVRSACKTVKTAENDGDYYDIYIGGKRVTSENKNDVFGDGTVSFEYDDFGNYVVTLNNATITSGSTVYDHLSAIYCDSYNTLRIKLIGDNTISIADEGEYYEYVSGIYSYYDICVEGEGSLTINVDCDYEYGYSYGINLDFESRDLYLEADGKITINMTGAAEEAKGIYAENFYNKNNGDVTVSVSDSYAAYGVYAYNTYLQSPANFTVSANFGEFEDSPYAYGLETCNLCDVPVSGPVYAEGKTQAIDIYGYNNVNMLMLTAYENADDADPVENPDWSQLSDYEKVELARAPYTVTPVLTTTEAECAWWDGDKEETVGNNGSIEIGWDVGEEEISEVYLYCDRYSEGYYDRKATIDPTVDSTYLLEPTLDYVLPGATLSWTIGAKFADGTVAFSEPFDLTFYKVRYDCDLEIYVDSPAIGYTPAQIWYFGHEYDDCYQDQPTLTWYKMDGETGVPMADDDLFMPGEQYAVIVEGTFVDSLRFDSETLNMTVVADGNIAESDAVYDDENNALMFGALFEPLKDMINYVSVTVNEPDSTMTPADVVATVDGYQYPPFSLPIVDGKVTTSWTYCEGDTYDEATAVAMENNEFFKGGNTYRGEVSFKVKDRFTMANEVGYVLTSGDPFGPSLPLSGTYDATTGIVTITLPDLMPSAVVKELNMFVREPEAGQTPLYIEAFGDELVSDYINAITIEWYEEDEEGTASDTPLASNEEFKAGVTYAMSMHVTLADAEFYNSSIPVTLNGQKTENYIVNDWDSAFIGYSFTIPETTDTVDALDFTVSAVKAGDTPADVAVTFDDTKVSFVDVYAYVYEGTGDPDKDVDHYADMASTDVFEYGKIYAIEVDYTLKAGLENDEGIALTINGEEPFVAGPDGKKYGTVAMNFTLEEPVLTLSADTTEFELGDEAIKAVNFDVEYTFDATNRLLVDVVDANGDDVFCTALTAGLETFSVDMSGFEVGTYTVTVTAYDGVNAIVSNSVDVEVKPAPTTTESTTATATETEPTATATEPTATATEPTATATEPTATATEPTATATETGTTTGTQADVILYGDANGDGEVNMKDVLTLRKHLAGIEIMLQPLNSDANGDGEINMKDVLMIRKYMAGLITVLGPTA